MTVEETLLDAKKSILAREVPEPAAVLEFLTHVGMVVGGAFILFCLLGGAWYTWRTRQMRKRFHSRTRR